MARIIVQSEHQGDNGASVMLQERVKPRDLESDHFSAQLIERVGWAVVDAEEAEHAAKAS